MVYKVLAVAQFATPSLFVHWVILHPFTQNTGPTALRPIRRLSVLLKYTGVTTATRTHTLLIRKTWVWIRCSQPLDHDYYPYFRGSRVLTPYLTTGNSNRWREPSSFWQEHWTVLLFTAVLSRSVYRLVMLSSSVPRKVPLIMPQTVPHAVPNLMIQACPRARMCQESCDNLRLEDILPLDIAYICLLNHISNHPLMLYFLSYRTTQPCYHGSAPHQYLWKSPGIEVDNNQIDYELVATAAKSVARNDFTPRSSPSYESYNSSPVLWRRL